jgi:hypothetical protein
MVGGCLLTVLVVCAALASSALAGEIGACVKKKGGKYENKTCTTTASGPKKAKYEWEPATKPLQLVTHGGELVFELSSKAQHKLTCASSRSSGEWVSGKEAEGPNLELESCSLAHTSEGCATGAKEGNLESGPWKAKLIDHGEVGLGGGEPAEGEAWIETYTEAGTPLFKFTCGPVLGEITGFLKTVVSPVDTALKEGKLGRKFKASFNLTFGGTGGDEFVQGTFNESEPFGASYKGLGEVALLAKESGYPKVKLEIKT